MFVCNGINCTLNWNVRCLFVTEAGHRTPGWRSRELGQSLYSFEQVLEMWPIFLQRWHWALRKGHWVPLACISRPQRTHFLSLNRASIFALPERDWLPWPLAVFSVCVSCSSWMLLGDLSLLAPCLDPYWLAENLLLETEHATWSALLVRPV